MPPGKWIIVLVPLRDEKIDAHRSRRVLTIRKGAHPDGLRREGQVLPQSKSDPDPSSTSIRARSAPHPLVHHCGTAALGDRYTRPILFPGLDLHHHAGEQGAAGRATPRQGDEAQVGLSPCQGARVAFLFGTLPWPHPKAR